MRIIDQLMTLQPQDFLNIENLRSAMDDLAGTAYGQAQYMKGVAIGNAAKVVHISITNVWSVEYHNGNRMQANETIGYHAHSAELMRGFIDSGVTIVVWRDIKEAGGSYRVVDTVIQGER